MKTKLKDKQVIFINKSNYFKPIGHKKGEGAITGKGDLVTIEHSTLKEIVHSFNWLVKGAHFETNDSESFKYSMEIQWPSTKQDVKKIMSDFGCTVKDTMMTFTEYEIVNQ